jgi:hypothetical protein
MCGPTAMRWALARGDRERVNAKVGEYFTSSIHR